MARTTYAPGKAGFLQWLSDAHPQILKKYLAEESSSLNGIDDDFDLGYDGYDYISGDYLAGLGADAAKKEEKPWYNNLIDLAKPLVQAYQQKQIFNAQLERAKRGLAPLQTDQMATQVKVKLEPSKETLSSLNKFVLPVGLGLGAIAVAFALRSGGGRRRRR